MFDRESDRSGEDLVEVSYLAGDMPWASLDWLVVWNVLSWDLSDSVFGRSGIAVILL